MTRVYVVVEGQTEETFVNAVLAPDLGHCGVFLAARLLGTAGHRGGNVTYARVKRDVAMLLKQDKSAYCTTLLDLYGLGKGFPGDTAAPRRPTDIEQAMNNDMIGALGGTWRADIRFIPYIQQYEFEGLLFSDPERLARGISQPQLENNFQNIRAKFATPEEINDSPQTAPSRRILQIYPPYQKPTHGVLVAKAMGLAVIRRQCPRFNAWITRLESLPTGKT